MVKALRNSRKATVKHDVIDALAWYYGRNGYVRRPSDVRLEEEGWTNYKKGSELRLVANSRAELRRIQRLLLKAGFRIGRPFGTRTQLRQPVYGHDQVDRFLELVETAKAALQPEQNGQGIEESAD